MNDLDDKQGSDSSDEPISNLTDDVAVDDSAAASSPATGEPTEEKSALDIVRDVTAQPEGQTASQAEPTEPKGGAQPPAAEAARQRPDAEDYSDVPFHKHPRFQQVLRERNEARGAASDAVALRKFMGEHGLSDQEVGEGLQIMGLMKLNPVEAWRRLQPITKQLLEVVGEILPDDLQQRVSGGELSEQAALELSRARSQSETLRATQAWREEQQRAEMERSRNQELAQSLMSAAEEWQRERERLDPRFADKLPLMQRELAFLQRDEGIPQTPAGVQAQLLKAYKSVNASFSPARPAPAARRPVVADGGANASPNGEESTLDIVRRLGRGR